MSIVAKKPTTQEVPMQQVVKITFDASNPYGTQLAKRKDDEQPNQVVDESGKPAAQPKDRKYEPDQETELRQKRTDTVESAQSDMTLVTPPFTIK